MGIRKVISVGGGGVHWLSLMLNFIQPLTIIQKLKKGVFGASCGCSVMYVCGDPFNLQRLPWETRGVSMDSRRIYLQCKHVGQESLI